MQSEKFSLNEYKNYKGKARVEKLFKDLNSDFSNLIVKQKRIVNDEIIRLKYQNKNTLKEPLEFYIPIPDTDDIDELQKMVKEYNVYKNKNNYELEGKWNKYIDTIDYSKNETLKNGINVLEDQKKLIEQIPLNRIQSLKIKLMKNLESQNKTNDKKKIINLKEEFVELQNQVSEISKKEKISETSISDVYSYNQFVKLDEKRKRAPKINFLIILTFSFLSFLSIILLIVFFTV